MTDIVLSPITSGYNLSKINSNFDKVENSINNDILHLNGGNNVMLQDLDLNNNALLNVKTNPDNPDSLLTISEGDQRYYNIDGDTLTGDMDVNNNRIINLPIPTLSHQAVRKDQLDNEIQSRSEADANLQAQISEGSPLEASAFSPISWHDQVISNSVNIPDNKNAWSFGPTMTINPGQVVTVGTNSYWTIANGEVV